MKTVALLMALAALSGGYASGIHAKTRMLRSGNFESQFLENGGTRIEIVQEAPKAKVTTKAPAKTTTKAPAKGKATTKAPTKTTTKAPAKAPAKGKAVVTTTKAPAKGAAPGTGKGASGAVKSTGTKVDAGSQLESGQNYGLCWSLNYPLTPVTHLEVDVTGALDVTGTSKSMAMALSTAISGYISFTVGLSKIISLKLIVMITVSAELKAEYTGAAPTAMEFVKKVLAHMTKSTSGKKDDAKGNPNMDAVDIMDLVKTRMGLETMYIGYRKLKQGQEKPNSITNSIARQNLIWASSLLSGFTANGKKLDKKAWDAKKITKADFTNGAAIHKLMGITPKKLDDCESWDQAFEDELKKGKKGAILVEGRKLRSRRPGMLCKLLYTYNTAKGNKKDAEMGKLLFPTASTTGAMDDAIKDINDAFASAHGKETKDCLFYWEKAWSVMPQIKNEIVDALDKAVPNPDEKGMKLTGSLGISAGVSLELNPPTKKCDMAAFTLGYTAGWSIEFPSKESTAIQTIEAKFSANPSGDASAATYKGVLYSENALWSNPARLKDGTTIGMTFEWDNKDGKAPDKTAAAGFALTNINGVLTYLAGKVSGAVADHAKSALKSAVMKPGLKALDPKVGSVATADTHMIDVAYDFKSKLFTGGYTSTQAVDFNMIIPGPIEGGVGGTFSQGKRTGFSLDKAKSEEVLKNIYEKVFRGKMDPKTKDVEEGNPEWSACDACVNTIMDKLNHQKGRDKCSAYADGNEVMNCKHVKEELEGLYVGIGFTDVTSHWYQSSRGSSTWQLFEPKFREFVCKGTRAKAADGTEFGKGGHLLWPKDSTVKVLPDDSSKKQYCDNQCSAADKMQDVKKDANKLAACKKSWLGFCRMLNFCPSKLMEAVDAFKNRKKPIAVKDGAEFHEMSRSPEDNNNGDKTNSMKHGPLEVLAEADCEDDDCDEED